MERKTQPWRICSIAIVALAAAWSTLAGAQSQPRVGPPAHSHAGVATAAVLAPAATTSQSASRWQLLANQPAVLDLKDCGPASPVLLTDGTVLVQDEGCEDWWKLTPDSFGSYVNGTWTQIASLPSGYGPEWHATAVLPDGRLIIEGGEYNELAKSAVPVWTSQGAIYDPRRDRWTSVNPPDGWTSIGDAPGVVLPDGTFMLGNCCTAQDALLDPRKLTWTTTGTGKFDTNNEEGWTLLPTGNVLAVDAYVPIGNIAYDPTGTGSELYNPATGSWMGAGSTIVQLWDSWQNCGQMSQEPTNGPTFELGPAVLRPDGTVFYAGSNTCPGAAGSTAIYNSYRGRWRAGPNLPDGLNIADGPAVLEPSGRVLVMASAGAFLPPSVFLEWDGEDLHPVEAAPNAANDPSYAGDFLILPTGQILFTDFTYVSIYTPEGHPSPAWAPQIATAPSVVRAGGSYEISGYLFNGMSQGAGYGDDIQAATNYPLVRITNSATGHVFYSRTHDHSSMAVASQSLVSTHFDVPRGQETGASQLVVIANGIASAPVSIVVRPADE